MADLRERLQTGLADRYRIERELGQGGMATVFLALDLRHDRPVALKVLHPELAATLGPERFQREIKLAARLQHPNILTVHDSGETDGQLWFTMPFVEGESLRDRLRRERQLSVDDALRIATDTARALDYAHHHGVVHRDIKPENLLLTVDGSTLVADFGIARALSGGDDHLTQTGMSVGTPAYMSPEQAAGDRSLDARTDVYSLGCVLYEMLAGEPPFTGPTAQAVIAKRFSGEIPHVRRVRPSVPEAVEQAITRALAPVVADRFATAAEFSRALAPAMASSATPTVPLPTEAAPSTVTTTAPVIRPRRRVPVGATALGIGFLLGLGVLFAWRRNHAGAGDPKGAKVLAVLPFENQGAAQDEYFADGVTDAVRGKLAAVPNLEVIARGSSAPYKKTSKTPQQIATELGARYLLTGTVRWQKGAAGASRVLVSPELVEVIPGRAPRTRWEQPFDAGLTDVFQVQSDIANRVTTALDVALGTSEKEALETKPTTNPAAYDFYLRGNEYFNRGVAEPDLRVAEGLYQKAIALDSGFALAFAQLSLTDDLLYWFYYDRSEERLAKQKQAADRALGLQPDLAEGHLALGYYYYHGRLDYNHALTELEAAGKRQPSNWRVYFGREAIYRRQGKWAEAVVEGKKAVELDPLSVNGLTDLALTEISVRAYPEAEPYLNRAIEVSPDQATAYLIKGVLYVLWRGDTIAAARVAREAFGKAGVEKVAPPLYAGASSLFSSPMRRALLEPAVAQVPLEAFGSDTVGYFLYRAELNSDGRNPERARAYLDSARVMLEAQAARRPNDPGFHARIGATCAKLGRRVEAVREGEKAVSLRPLAQDAVDGARYRLTLAGILARVGQADAAIDQLTYLLSVPSLVSVPALRVDHTWDPLRGNPRFERLVNGT